MSTPANTVRPLLRARQAREFTDQSVDDEALQAVADAARWSGSSRNSQPWRFVIVRRRETLDAIAESSLPSTRALSSAPAAIAITMPAESGGGISLAYDEGRAAERMLVAASMLGLGAGITWVKPDVRPAAAEALGLPGDRFVRTIVAIGHPTSDARRSKSAQGEARLPREKTVLWERWPG
ncbi:MAG TPA: nitroreductase family protein [Candidatus Limnocylindria bacterium]